MVLVKGVSRRVIVVDSPDPQVFEQAIFILSGDGAGVSQQQLVDQAVRVARSYARTTHTTAQLPHDTAAVDGGGQRRDRGRLGRRCAAVRSCPCHCEPVIDITGSE